MSNPGRFDVDIKSIRRRLNFDEFPRHFHVLFRCNFADRRIHVVSTYSFWRDFAGRKIHAVSTYFFRCNFDGRKTHVVSTYFFSTEFQWSKNPHCFHVCFFDVVCLVEISTMFLLTFFDVLLMGKNSTSFLVSCKLMQTFEEVFLCL